MLSRRVLAVRGVVFRDDAVVWLCVVWGVW